MILLHDGDGSGGGASREQTVAALPVILDELERLGLRSVPLSTMLPSCVQTQFRGSRLDFT